MKLPRRTFLSQAALGSAGLAAASTLRGADAKPPAALPAFDERAPEAFWSAVRAQLPLSRDLIYFNTGGLGPTSEPVLALMAETTRKLQMKSEHGHGLFTEARAVVARFLAADPAEIAFVRNATEANSIVAAGLKLTAGDEVIFETHAHPGGSFPWLNQEKLRGIKVKLFEPDPHDASENVARIRNLMTARTRAVQVSHVTAPTGIVMPVHEIARLCRERGIWFHLDGAQSAGMFPVAMRELGCDSYATSGHKWLAGPLETGILFVRRERLDEIAPVLVGAYSGELESLPGELKLAPTAVRYEYGTRNSVAAVGLAEAVKLQERIGVRRIAERGRLMTELVRDGLGRLGGVEILTPRGPGMSASMITFRSKTVPYDQLFGRLLREYAIRARPVTEQGLNALRVSTHFFNSPAECEKLIGGMEKILRSA
jgi:selenocysteine lyase/cysteine desulfurase